MQKVLRLESAQPDQGRACCGPLAAILPWRLLCSNPVLAFTSTVQSVGKTSIITRFMYDKFDTTYQVGDRVCS